MLPALFLIVSGGLALGDPSWKKGDDLGTIVTTNGTTYSEAKLEEVEPDGISILDSDGGAKINFDKLPPDLQKRFGYDPGKGAAYAREQALLQQIDQLQRENAMLRQRLNLATNDSPHQQPASESSRPSIAGYHYFLFSLQSQSGGLKAQQINAHSAGLVYAAGPLAGMRPDEAREYAMQQWQQMSRDDQMSYENQAKLTGDPLAQTNAAGRSLAPSQQTHQYIVTPTGGGGATVTGY